MELHGSVSPRGLKSLELTRIMPALVAIRSQLLETQTEVKYLLFLEDLLYGDSNGGSGVRGQACFFDEAVQRLA